MSGTVLRVITRLNRGGPLRQLEALVPGLERLGWSGPVLAGRVEDHEPDGTEDLLAVGADVVRVPSLQRGIDPGADGRALREVLAWIHRTKPDLVHTHMGKAGAIGRTAARLVGVPAVHTFHGHHFSRGGAGAVAALAAERVLGRATDAVVCLSESQRHDVVERYRVVPARKAHVIGPGIDVHQYVLRAVPARKPGGRPLFVWAGRFVPVKDPLLLIQAVALSKREFTLVMLGEGPLRRATIEAAQRAGLASVVECPGPMVSTAPWIASCDGVVLSSRSEGTPIVILEARVLGKPVLAPSVGGVPDLITHDVTGLLVPPNDASALAAGLDRLASDAPLRTRLGTSEPEHPSIQFSGARLCRATAELYARVFKCTRSTTPH